ncbi:alpha/beta fold hydrolase [Streptomyces mirabilis]|uniref:alpha/beta fold hydrolase n=1 Tax=Streptomyces mirabilis TaxID=68239 RepID=UPI003689623D
MEDFADVVGAIDVPVLVLAGSHDKVDPPQVLREHLLPKIPTADLVGLDGTGHLSPLEVPDQVASHITAFVTELRSLKVRPLRTELSELSCPLSAELGDLS